MKNNKLQINKEKLEKLADFLPYERVEIFRPRKGECATKASNRYQLWKTYHFPDRHHFKPPIYQDKSNQMKIKLIHREIKSYAEIGYAECGKTSDIRYLVLYSVLYNMDSYVLYQSSVQANKDNWTTSILDLLLRDSIVEDYGQLIDTNRSGLSVVKKKRRRNLNYLDLTNNTRIEARGFNSSVRGSTDIFTGRKPTMYISDDIVTSKIAQSDILKENINNQLNEALRSTDSSYGVNIFLGNVIPGGGLSNEIIESKKMPFLVIPLTKQPYCFDGNETRYVKKKVGETNWIKWKLTTKETRDLNKRRRPENWFSSVEEKKKILSNYDSEMECVLLKREDLYFRKHKGEAVKHTEILPILGSKLFIYKHFNSESLSSKIPHYCVGIDPSAGEGGDYTALVVYEGNTKEVVAYLQDKNTTPKDFFSIVERVIELYSEKHQEQVIVNIERNGVGLALIELMKGKYSSCLFKDKKKDRPISESDKVYGFTTTSKSKQKIFSKLAGNIDEIKVNDEILHSQLSTMRFADFNERKRRGLAHNFDGVVALALAFHCASNPRYHFVCFVM